MTDPRGETRRARLTGGGLGAAVGAWTAAMHHGLGPAADPRLRSWNEPSGFLLEWLASSALAPLTEDVRLTVLAAALPAAALALAVGLVTRSVLARPLALTGVVASGLLGFYGVQAPLVWDFFGWRWSASMAAFAAVVAPAALAPLWAARWLRLPSWARIASYAPLFLALVWLERDVTGTDPALRFSISPWPAVQIFGLEVVASTIAALLLGVAAGLALLELAPERPPAVRGGAALLGAAIAGVFPAAPLVVGASQGVLPFQPGPGLLGATAAAAALTYAVAGWGAGGQRRWRRTAVWTVAALGLAAPLAAGQALTRLDYQATREQRAGRILAALDQHFRREGLYPDRLEALVEAGDLATIPKPRIGFALGEDPEFTYQGFGTSFLLEFSAPRWIQCAYSPPYLDEEEDAAEPVLEEAWSCPSRPPDLW